jgi:hypothetical protein
MDCDAPSSSSHPSECDVEPACAVDLNRFARDNTVGTVRRPLKCPPNLFGHDGEDFHPHASFKALMIVGHAQHEVAK